MKLLIIEDNLEVVENVSLYFQLGWPGVKIISATSGAQGIELAGTALPNVIILDLNLPDIDGLDVLSQIRLFSNVQVIILTVRDSEIDIVKGLEKGADDYIIQPSNHIVLLAKVKAVLRRTYMPQLKEDKLSHFVNGNLIIDFTTREVKDEDSGEVVKLTPIKFNLLSYLVRNRDSVLTHQALLEKVWGAEYSNERSSLKKYISSLRHKLRDNSNNPRMIVTERGVGYKFVSAE